MRDNPYVGLRPFTRADSLYFFGRLDQTMDLLNQLYRTRFLAVVGSSGCGKSSLIRAGLIPGLEAGFLVEERDRWLMATMRPGDNPLGNLAEALCKARPDGRTPGDVAALRDAIAELHTQGALDSLERVVDERTNLLILVDQFEEIFAFRGTDADEEAAHSTEERTLIADRRAEASDFVNLLLELSEQKKLPIYVVMTMRTDFLGDCDLFYGLPEAMNRGRYLVPRLTRQQLREAVDGPARLFKRRIAPRLSERLLNELGARFDRLPVLQHALLRTWDAWRGDPASDFPAGDIDFEHYQAAGKLDGALAKDAENATKEAIAASEEVTEDAVARIFKALTDTDESHRRVRRPAKMSEIASETGLPRSMIDEVVKHFKAKNRWFLYVSSDGDEKDPRVDIAHESLIRQWAKLRKWVDKETQSRDHFVDLFDRATKSQAGEGEVLTGVDLDVKVAWKKREQPNAPWADRYAPGGYERAMEFLERSRAARRKRDRIVRGAAIAFLALFVIVGVLGAEASRQAKNAGESADRAQLEAERAIEASARAVESSLRAKEASGQALVEAAAGRARTRSAQAAEATALDAQRAALLAQQAAVVARRTAESRRLALLASTHLEEDPELSFRLAQAAVLALEVDTSTAPAGELPMPNAVAWIALREAYNESRIAAADTLSPAAALNALRPLGYDPLKTVSAASEPTSSIRRRGLEAGVPDDERTLIVVSRDRERFDTIRAPSPVVQITFNESGDRLASAHEDGTARLWDPVSTRQVRDFPGHEGRVNWVAFDANGSRLATAGQDGTIRVWTVDGGPVPFAVLRGHRAPVRAVAFDPAAQHIVASAADDCLGSAGIPDWCRDGGGRWRFRRWNVQTGEERPGVSLLDRALAALMTDTTRASRSLTPQECDYFLIPAGSICGEQQADNQPSGS